MFSNILDQALIGFRDGACFLAEQVLFRCVLCAAFLSVPPSSLPSSHCVSCLHTLGYQHPLGDLSLLVPPLQQITGCPFAPCPLIKEWLSGLNLHLLSLPRALDLAVCGHSTEMNHGYLKLIRSQATHPSLAKDTHLHALLMKSSSSSSHYGVQTSNTLCISNASLSPSTWCISGFSHFLGQGLTRSSSQRRICLSSQFGEPSQCD